MGDLSIHFLQSIRSLRHEFHERVDQKDLIKVIDSKVQSQTSFGLKNSLLFAFNIHDYFSSLFSLFKEIMSQNLLVEVPLESLPALRDKFKVDWPTHISAFSLIDNFIRRFDNKYKTIGAVIRKEKVL